MFNYTFHTRPIHSTLKFWEKLQESLGDINITYVNVPNENSLIDVLTQSDKPDLYLFDFSGEAIYDEDLLLNKFSNLIDRPFVSLSCNPIWFFKEHETKVFFPCWYFDVYYTNINYKQTSFSPNKQYLVSCLNRAVKIPRVYNLVRLYKLGHLNNNDLLITFKHYDVYPSNNHSLPNDDSRIIYPQDMDWSILESNFKNIGIHNFTDHVSDIKNTYTFLFNDFPLNPLNENLSQVLDDHTINHPAYLQSFSNLITESITHNLFYTEKTFKALAVGMPFWLQGGINSVLYLDLFGFDTYSDIELFDYCNYDTVPNFIERTDRITSLASSLLKEKTATDISSRQMVNQEMFYSDKTYNMFFQHLLSKIRKVIA